MNSDGEKEKNEPGKKKRVAGDFIVKRTAWPSSAINTSVPSAFSSGHLVPV